MHQKHFLSNLNVLEYNRFIELVCCKKNIFLFIIFKIWEKWVPLIGFWIKFLKKIFKFILHLGEPKTTCLFLIPKIDPP